MFIPHFSYEPTVHAEAGERKAHRIPAKIEGLNEKISEISEFALQEYQKIQPQPFPKSVHVKFLFDHLYKQTTKERSFNSCDIVILICSIYLRTFRQDIGFIKTSFLMVAGVIGYGCLTFFFLIRRVIQEAPQQSVDNFFSKHVGRRLEFGENNSAPAVICKSVSKVMVVSSFIFLNGLFGFATFKAFSKYVPANSFRRVVSVFMLISVASSQLKLLRSLSGSIFNEWRSEKAMYLLNQVKKPAGFDEDPVMKENQCSISCYPILFPVKLGPCGDRYELSDIAQALKENGSCPNCRYGQHLNNGTKEGGYLRGKLKAEDIEFDHEVYDKIKARIPHIGEPVVPPVG